MRLGVPPEIVVVSVEPIKKKKKGRYESCVRNGFYFKVHR